MVAYAGGSWAALPLGCPKCDGTFCAKQTQQKHIATCPGKKAKSGPMVKKNTRVMSVLKSTPQRLHSKITKRCTRAQNKKYVCSLCGKALGSTTALHRHEKIHQDH